jgi:type IV pilus assembly protein PilC
MAKFTYKAINGSGKTISGVVDSASLESANDFLSRQGLTPIIVKPKGSGALDLNNIFGAKVKLKDMVIFTRQLATMINAGVPLVRSLATLQTQTESKALKEHLLTISKDIEGGASFADALEKHPEVFSPIYINMVRAGEAGGILDEILKKLALQQEKDAKIRAKFKSAMTYPTILLSITGIVFIGLMTIVMPKIGGIVKDLSNGAALPPITVVMLAISNVMVKFWYVIIGGIIGTIFGLNRYTKTPGGKRWRDRTLMRVPVLKQVIVKVAVARFSRIFASMMGAGVSVLDSIEITGRAIGNTVLEDELMNAAKMVANGSQLSQPLAESKVFPAIVSQMLGVGEETGQIDEVLIKVAEFYEDEVDATVESLSSILEPIMIVVMGTMVGLIAASVISPISNLSNQI